MIKEKWYGRVTNVGGPHEQGLIADEETGASIAVCYDPKYVNILAAAPAAIDVLKWLAEEIGDAGSPRIPSVEAIAEMRDVLSKAAEDPK